MRKARISIIVLFSLSILMFTAGCAGKPEQIFGFEITEDYDDPVVEFLNPTNGSYYLDPEYIQIYYSVIDVSGIQYLELYVDDEMVFDTNSEIFLDGSCSWDLDYNETAGYKELQLYVQDNLGKEGWSEPVNIYIEFSELK